LKRLSEVTVRDLQAPPVQSTLRTFNVCELGSVVYEHVLPGVAEVAVVVPLYNYQPMIENCLVSVATQDLQPLSLIIIDDASTDDGGKIAAAVVKSYRSRFSTARIIRHHRNQGLSMARNSGIAWSHEPYLFMLDADNRIRRSCLIKLLEAIKTSGAAFAYSQLRMFGEIDAIGQADVWDPERLSEGNYIDAMALVCRGALERTRGYTSLVNEYGWED
jgi:glycosyltransferase involved in cell wall biosynthesis